MSEESAGFSVVGTAILGRDASAVDVQLDHPTVARRHAELHVGDGVVRIRDLGSGQGTFVNGAPVSGWVTLAPEDRIDIGPFSLSSGGQLPDADRTSAPEIVAAGLTRTVAGNKNILEDVSLLIPPHSFVTILGPSGAGKSTLLKAIGARERASVGSVTINGVELYANFNALKDGIAFVPQQEVLHNELPLRAALRYTGQLRLPRDMSAAEVDRYVDEAAAKVELTPHLDTQIGKLSGGQRKRASLASEIIASPSLMFLDEVTSGLDELSDHELMRLCRKLADEKMSILCVTHNLANVEQFCHQLIVLAVPGVLAFHGSPAEALEYFGVKRLGEIYQILPTRDGAAWSAKFEDYRRGRTPQLPGAAGAAAIDASSGQATLRRSLRQFGVCLRRNLHKLYAERRTWLSATVQSVLVAGALSAAFGGTLDSPRDQASMLFLLAVSAFWFGCNFSAKEIVRELSIYEQERNVNLMVRSYLGAKFVSNVMFNSVQVIVLLAIVKTFCEVPGDFVAQLGLLLLTAAVGVALGLALSAFSASYAQASTLVPLVLIPQLVFSGVIVESLPEVVQRVTEVLVSVYWSFEGLQQVFAEQSRPALEAAGVLGAHLVAFLVLAAIGLRVRGRSGG